MEEEHACTIWGDDEWPSLTVQFLPEVTAYVASVCRFVCLWWCCVVGIACTGRRAMVWWLSC
jgi:hypothetical protein